ncbi:MAG: AIR synthase family protein [Nitrososphaerales archaeon]
MKPLPLGKIPIEILDATVLKMTGASSPNILTPPRAGLDFCAIKLDHGFMIVSADPITGVSSEIGRYAIRVSSNDVATSGNRPQFAETVILLPEQSDVGDLARLARQIDTAAREIGLAIVGGHTEVTPGLRKPIIIVTVFSFVERYVTSQDAQEGDTIMMTKTAGLEGTAAIARELDVSGAAIPQGVARRASRFIDRLSVAEEAVAAFKTGQVNAMHDCTEGGVLGAAYEMSLASGLGFELKESSVPVAPETRAICGLLSLDPLKLIGSGSLLISVKTGSEEKVKEALSGVCKASVIGRFTGRKRILLRADGSESRVPSAPQDELWRALRSRR